MRQFYQMQTQIQGENNLEQKKRYMLTINSLNNTTNSSKRKNLKTLQKNQRSNLGLQVNSSSLESQLLATKIINVQLKSQLFNVAHRFYKNYESSNKMLYPNSQRTKGRYNQKSRQMVRRGKGGIKVIAKYRAGLPDQRTPMKKYIKIQKIQLPLPDPLTKNYFNKTKTANFSNLSDNMKKTIDDYSRYIEKRKQSEIKSSIPNFKVHKRNHSSIIGPLKNSSIDDNLTVQRSSKKLYSQEFPVRRPLGRKDYFVFGLSDRNNPQNKVQYYRDFLWKINYSNALNVYTPDQINNPYKAYIGPGNNYHLVKSVLKRRFWWTILDKPESTQSLNFMWTQLKQNYFFNIQTKSDYQIDTDQNLNSSILTLVRSDSQTTKQPTPSSSQQDFHKKLFSRTDYYNWTKHQTRNQKTQEKITQLTYVKRLPLFQNKEIRNIQNSSKLKIHNHLESNFFIGNKKALFYNMRRYLTLKNVDPFTILPLTFHIAKGTEDSQFKVFKKHYEQIQSTKNVNGLRNIWIVKPGENTNRGNGITVAYSLDDIMVRLKGREKNSDGKLRTFIIQKYIQKPLLYYRRKFDIRHYMLITCTNGIFKSYWYQQGYIRTSSSQFTTKYSKDPFVHLTNDAIQKNGANYGRFEKGNKLSYQQFQKYIQLNYKNKKINFFDHILPQMKQMAAQSVRATYAILDQNRRQHNFQLLGLDFMIDQDFKPWLIQVNTNPCLELSCSLLQKIIPQLVDNVFRICIDPLFPPPECWQSGKKLYFGESPLSQNKFQIIFDECDHGEQIQNLYIGNSILDEKMGKIEEDDQIFQDDGNQNWQDKK